MTRESQRTSADADAFPRLASVAQPEGAVPPISLVEECLRRAAEEAAHSRVTALARSASKLELPSDLEALTVPPLAELTILVQPPEGLDGEWSIVKAVDVGDAVVVDEFVGAKRLPSHLLGAIDLALAHGMQEYHQADSNSPSRPAKIAIPLQGRRRTFGLLTLSHEQEGRQFDLGDQRSVETLTAQAASSQDNARHCRELEEADRRKTESLSVLAHELRNPLAAIRYAVSVLRSCSRDEAAVRSAQDVIDNQVTHLVRLVDDLSDVSRVANGKIRLELESFDLATLVRDAVETSRTGMEARGHRLTFHLTREPLPVHADRMRLSQVLGNLLHNATKYTRPGGSVDVSAEREGDEAIVRVRDNGVGILAATLPKIFDMFAQVDRSRDMSQGGLGIGLALVRSLVEMHFGSVQAASGGIDCGSEFTVRLPLAVGSVVQS